MKILISGKNSQLGQKLLSFVKDSSHEFIFLESKDMNLKDPKNIKDVVDRYKPEVVLNLSAYTDVDNAEDNIDEVNLVNASGPKYFAAASQNINAYFLQISTDYVFGEFDSAPYSSLSKPGPLNSYGLSKLRGEINSLSSNNKSIILRTSSLYSEFGNNFVKIVAKKLIQKEDLRVISDQNISMTYADDLVKALLVFINKEKLEYFIARNPKPIIHYANDGFTTWFDVAEEILENLNEYYEDLGTLTPISHTEWFSKASRPIDSRLEIDYSLLKSLDIKLRPWKLGINEVLKKVVGKKGN